MTPPALMTADYIQKFLREVSFMPTREVNVNRDVLKGILSELFVVRGAMSENDTMRIALVKSLTMQCAMVWMMGVVNDMRQTNYGGMTTDEVLELMSFRIGETLNTMLAADGPGGKS